MLAYWKQHEDYDAQRCLVLCSGDAMSGPALSTFFKGDAAVTVMDLMGYDACTLGVHEFDYGREHMAAWGNLANFPFLAANLQKADGSACNLAQPYTIVTKQGVKIGIIGLVNMHLDKLADKADGLKTIPYADALRAVVPQVRAAGAQVVIVLANVPQTELLELAKVVAALNIPLFLGGESRETAINKAGRSWVVSSGENWDAYARVMLEVTPEAGRVFVQDVHAVWLQGEKLPADKAVVDAMTAWQQKMNAMMHTVLGTSAAALGMGSTGLYNFVDDCMLESDAKADIALTNYGGLRHDLPAGQITVGDIFTVMPFDDSLYRLTLSGGALTAYLHEYDGEKNGAAGLSQQGGQYVLTKTGQPLDTNASYRVTVNNYMYEQSPLLQAADPLPTTVYADWRQPLFDWLAKHPTSADKPLDKQVDTEVRLPF